ncbi:MAG: type II CAAX prenyl endopeptidase Rce1 family protein [Archangium sp.]
MPSRTFLLVAFGFSWSVAAVLALIGDFTTPVLHAAGGFVFMCGPLLGALAAWKLHRLPRSSFGLSAPNVRWLFSAWVWGVLIVAAAIALTALLPGASLATPGAALLAYLKPEDVAKVSASMPEPALSVALLFQASVLGPLLNLPMMLSEELGWRGVWWSRLESLGFWSRVAVIGPVWGVWHAPLIVMGHNYPGHPVLGVALMVLFCVLLSVPMHVLRERGGSVWVACMFHGTINALNTLSLLCLSGASTLVGGVPGLIGCSVLLCVCAILWWFQSRETAGP